jgi:hypothetical protein
MSKFVVRTGLLLALVCPAVVLVAFLLWPLMPQCQAGSIGPAAGCSLLGVNLNWFMNLFVIAFMGMFLLSPLGLVVLFIGKYLARRSAQ